MHPSPGPNGLRTRHRSAEGVDDNDRGYNQGDHCIVVICADPLRPAVDLGNQTLVPIDCAEVGKLISGAVAAWVRGVMMEASFIGGDQ